MIKRLFEIAATSLLINTAVYASSISADNATIRAMPEGVPNTAGYLNLTAQAQDDALIAAACEGVNKTELHTLLMEDGVMKMRPVTKIDLPQGETVTLAQGGYHLMMMGLSKTPVEGEQLSCTLKFEKSSPLTVSFAIKRVDNQVHHHHH